MDAYDYVIVGAGSAGCVLAARQSEDPATRVLVLEVGLPDDAAEIPMPAATPLLWSMSAASGPTTTPGPAPTAAPAGAMPSCCPTSAEPRTSSAASSSTTASGGPLRVEDPRYLHPQSQAWVAAATASGLAANDDFNGAAQDGVGFYQATQRAGRRWSTADAYLS